MINKENYFKRTRNTLVLFLSTILVLLAVFMNIQDIQSSLINFNEQSLNENSDPITSEIISQDYTQQLESDNIDSSSNPDDSIYSSYTAYPKSKSSRSSSKSQSSDSSSSSSSDTDSDSQESDPGESENLDSSSTEDSTTDSDSEETNPPDNPQSSDDENKLIDDEDFIDVIVMLKDDQIDDDTLRITENNMPQSKSIKSQVEVKQNEVLSKLDPTELRIKHRYNTINGFSGKITKESLAKLEQDPNVEAIYEDKILHITLDESVPLINADDIWQLDKDGNDCTVSGEPCLTGEDSVVCVVDSGIDYTHPDLGGCTGRDYDIDGNIVSHPLESTHPYNNSGDYTWTIKKEGFDNIAVHFSDIKIKANDYIYIMKADSANMDDRVQTFFGNHKDIWSVSVPGDTIAIRLATNWDEDTDWGFAIDKVLDGTTFSLQNCEKVIDGRDFWNSDCDPMDDNSHGTHVAGIIASTDNTYKGVAPDAKLLAVKVCGSGITCSYASVIAGVDWCNSLKSSNTYNIVATTMSLGEHGQYNSETCPKTGVYQILNDAINTAHNLGIAVTVASGNEYHSNGISHPACSPNAISVGSTTKSDVISDFTNTGNLLDVLAPGSSIYSTVLHGGYESHSGTSMATPHVAGAVALLKQFSPLASPNTIKNALKSTGIPITDSDNGLSFPRIDILAAMDYTECSSNSECGTDGYTGGLFCQNDDVKQNYITYTCNNPGEFAASCSSSTSPKLKEDCENGCSEGSCNEPEPECIEICNYGMCYEYCE